MTQQNTPPKSFSNFQDLKKEYSAKNTTLVDKFKEVEEILLAKTELVDALTKQLENIRKDQTRELSLKQSERDQYKKSLEEMTFIAEKVPILEAEILQLSKVRFYYLIRISIYFNMIAGQKRNNSAIET